MDSKVFIRYFITPVISVNKVAHSNLEVQEVHYIVYTFSSNPSKRSATNLLRAR